MLKSRRYHLALILTQVVEPPIQIMNQTLLALRYWTDFGLLTACIASAALSISIPSYIIHRKLGKGALLKSLGCGALGNLPMLGFGILVAIIFLAWQHRIHALLTFAVIIILGIWLMNLCFASFYLNRKLLKLALSHVFGSSDQVDAIASKCANISAALNLIFSICIFYLIFFIFWAAF